MPITNLIFKATFLKGNPCTKAFYLDKFYKELRDEISDAQEPVFTQGINVGLLARDLFPNGIEVSPQDYTLPVDLSLPSNII